MYRVLILFAVFFLSCAAGSPPAVRHLPDEPEHPGNSTAAFKTADSYGQVLEIWKTPEDVSAWMGQNFSYDRERAIQLSETRKTENETPPIYSPAEFFRIKTGVCIDLSRFGVETLRSIDPDTDPKYLMIEFVPIRIDGHTIRLHWLAGFKRDGKYYFFADSRRPGHMAGPYSDIQTFIKEYQDYRGREIVGYRELDSYRKKQKALSAKEKKNPAEGDF